MIYRNLLSLSLVHGAHSQSQSYSDAGFAKMEVNAMTREQQARFKQFPMQGLLVQTKIDPQIIDDDSDNLSVWFNRAGVPERGITEEMIGMGDILGYLVEEGL